MEKKTLVFPSLNSMAEFIKSYRTGFFMNTNKLTITSAFSDQDLRQAMEQYNARLLETSDKVYTY